MDSVNRRALLAGGLVVGTSALPGCPGVRDDTEPNNRSNPEGTPKEQEYDAENPFSILLVNDGDGPQNVAINISRNGNQIFEDTIEINPDERTTVAEYETTGYYTIRAESDDHQMEVSTEIKRENLMTHRAASGRITVDEDGVLIRVQFDD